jgi:FkbM family methyltransferase
MKPESLVRLSRLTRPIMRYRTPVLHRLLRLALNVCCPPKTRRSAASLVVGFDGGLINVDTSSSIEYDLLFRGCHEPEIVKLIQHTVDAGDVCLDVGANIGAHTLVMARNAGPSGRVIAVEPHPRLCARLRQNVDLNRLSNITIVAAALSSTDGETELYAFTEDAFHQGSSSLLPDREAQVQIKVRSISGATLQHEYRIDSCRLLKIDVEGAEGLILNELSELINTHRPAIIFEFRTQHWEKFGYSIDGVLDRLRVLRYDFYYVRKNVTRPLNNHRPPESCELFCVPRSAN